MLDICIWAMEKGCATTVVRLVLLAGIAGGDCCTASERSLTLGDYETEKKPQEEVGNV